MTDLRAPFPWFGGKSRVAPAVWKAFGDVQNYVEPFFGSGAMLLGRPGGFTGPETVNDLDGYLANFWRAIQHDPELVAHWTDWPVNENDLHARHAWLMREKADFVPRLEGDPEFYDARIAGWWVWGLCSWIGSGWCSGSGPWGVVEGQLVNLRDEGDAGQGINRKLPHLGDAGRGINRNLPHLGDGQGTLVDYFVALAGRLRGVRVCCGDWSRVVGGSVTYKHAGITGIFLDPPYSEESGCAQELYAHDSTSIAHQVREWAIANGNNPKLRIALCGYEGEHEMPDSWRCHAWKAGGGFGSGSQLNINAARERVWFSPACIAPTHEQPQLFEGIA